MTLFPDSYLVTRVGELVCLGMVGVGRLELELDEALELGAAMIRAARPEATRRRRPRAPRARVS